LAKRISARLTAQQGRRFGVTVGVAFAALGWLLWWRDHMLAAAIVGPVGGLLVLGGFGAPPLPMGILHFLVIAPMGFVMRLFGKNPLTAVESDGSFWVSRAEEDDARGGMTHQF